MALLLLAVQAVLAAAAVVLAQLLELAVADVF
jgi:hypothetical protein